MISVEETEALLRQPTLTSDECLLIVTEGQDEFGGFTAEGLLEDRLGTSIATRFKRLNTTMIKLLEDVRKSFPDAEYYTASGGFNLMIGRPHDDRGQQAQQELVALSGAAQVGDGDF